MDISKIEINPQFRQAIDIIEGGKNIFVTGKAGTGKSTLLEYFRATTKRKIVVLAPTGVAAVNVGGQTIHSFFRFKPDITPQMAERNAGKTLKHKGAEIYNELDTIIIDEISMARADLFDCIDRFLRVVRKTRHEPFGGAQIAMIGDLYQLPPVVTSQERTIFSTHYNSPYFFDAHAFAGLKPEFIELEKIYRQKDKEFIHLLNSIRNNSVSDGDITALNRRYIPNFKPDKGFYIHLTTINAKASEINNERLASLSSKLRKFEGYTEGEFERNSLPTELELNLKSGAQIMLLNNDSLGRWVNGTVGKIKDIDDDVITIELENGREEDVERFTWELFKYELDAKTHSITTDTVGTFTQFPLRLAWAVTIHKSQGKTFDRAIIDFGRGTFASGQAYVALSRCRTLSGIVLTERLKKSHILIDYRIIKFLTQYQYGISEEMVPLEQKIELIKSAIKNRRRLNITYLKAQDVKSKRTIRPLEVGTMEYAGKNFQGMRAYCENRGEERTFRVDRILELTICTA